MSTNPKEVEQKSAKTPSFKSIDRDIRTLTAAMEQEKTLMPESQSGRIARLVKIYNGIKPLLTVLASLPLIPSSWRAALVLFNSALAAVAAGADEVSAEFTAEARAVFRRDTEKKYVVWHGTAGRTTHTPVSGRPGKATTSIDGWNLTADRVGAPWLVDRDGTIYKTFDDSGWIFHLGLKGTNGRYDKHQQRPRYGRHQAV